MVHIIDLDFLGNKTTIASFLIESEAGPILIETGPYSHFENLKKGVEKLGYQIEDIKNVLLTHIHLDHTGGAWALAEKGATIYMHPFGTRHMIDPSKLLASAKMIYKEDMDRLWGDLKPIPEENVKTLEHGEELLIGNRKLIAWHTPGHANHHIAWQLDKVVFTGDVAGVKINEGPVLAPCAPPDINLEKWHHSLEILRKINPEKLYLTHFGEVNNTLGHLEKLEENLHLQANWIKKYWDKQESIENITPIFQAWNDDILKQNGVDTEALEQYNTANPAWMNVMGLMRYWTKKNA